MLNKIDRHAEVEWQLQHKEQPKTTWKTPAPRVHTPRKTATLPQWLLNYLWKK